MTALADAQAFGKYTLVAKIATGGMAEIFLARLQGAAGFEKLVCIKRILPHLAADTTLTSMFLAEAQIAAQISHPNVCQVFELGELDGRYYIAMEYLEGVPFSCVRSETEYPAPTEPRLVAGLVMQACEGLHHAHNLKRSDGSALEVVHRDVTPNNLFVTTDGVVKVLDFGIAKFQDATVKTSTGALKGTHSYMSPEQLRGQQVDRRTDVFAMGVVLWELLARRSLFKRDTDFLTFEAVIVDPIPALDTLRPDVPPELGAVVARALARGPDQRYPTARALGEALGEAMAPLGGVLPAVAIGEEIQRAFDGRLREQRGLVQVARSGDPRPVEQALDVSEAPPEPPAKGTRPATATTSVQGRPDHTHATAALATARTASAWRRNAALVGLALTAGAAAVYWSRTPDEPPDDAIGGSVERAARAPEQPTAPRSPGASVDAQLPEAPGADAATPADGSATKHTAAIRKPAMKSVAAARGGPNGFITIDSSPVYADIYVDGKHRGQTPLVRLSLPPGKHTVKAVAPSGPTKTLTIMIEPGKLMAPQRIEW